MKNKILITGSNGQLGRCIADLESKYTQYEFIFTDIEQLDITSQDSVNEHIGRLKPKWVINTAAYTLVDKAESDTQKALLLNAKAVGYLAEATKNIGAGIVHISTDYVYRGDEPIIIDETQTPSPISVYGITKLQGDIEAQNNPNHIILRTSWLYSIYGKNFVKTMRQLGKTKSEINVVSDQWGNPTSAHDLAEAIMQIIDKPSYGIFHYSNEGSASWAIFAEQIMEYSGLDCKINHITAKEYPTDAERPEYSLLSKSKITSTFGITIPEWEHSLEGVIDKLNKSILL